MQKPTPELIAEIGFDKIVTMFSFYGFLVDANPSTLQKDRKKKLIIGLHVLSHIGHFLYWVMFMYSMINHDKLTNYITAMGFGLFVFNVRICVNYLLVYLFLDNCLKLIWDLAMCLDTISTVDRRQSCSKMIKHWAKVTFVATIVTVMVLTMVNAVNINEFLESYPTIFGNSTVDWVFFKTALLLLACFLTIGSSFFVFFQYFLLLVCLVLIMYFDCLVPCVDPITNVMNSSFYHPFKNAGCKELPMPVRQINHQRMSTLVKRANAVFSIFLLTSVIEEVAAIVMYGGGIELGFISPLAMFTSVLATALKLTLFLAKIIFSSAVNDKVRDSLILSSTLDFKQEAKYSLGEFANYLMYIKQQSMTRAGFSYGGFFAAKQSLIFTMLITALTYVLVIKDL